MDLDAPPDFLSFTALRYIAKRADAITGWDKPITARETACRDPHLKRQNLVAG